MARFVILRKGGGGKVAINPEQVAFVRSAAGAFTDVFFNGHQVAVEGTFEEVVKLLAPPVGGDGEPGAGGQPRSAFGRFER